MTPLGGLTSDPQSCSFRNLKTYMRLDFESAVATPQVSAFTADTATDAASLLKSGIAAAQNGDRRSARLLLTQVTESDPRNVDAWLWLASISEYPEELLVFLDKVLAIDPKNERAVSWEAATCSLLSKTQVQRASIAFEEGNTSQAAQCIDKALEYDEKSVPAWLWKAKLATKQEDMLECMERVLVLDDGNQEAREAIDAASTAAFEEKVTAAKAMAAAGDMDEAAHALAELLAAKPANVELWVLSAHVSRSFEAKFEAYDQILKLEPANEFAQYGHDFLSSIALATAPAVESEMASEVETPVSEPHDAKPHDANHGDLEAAAQDPVEEFVDQPTVEEYVDEPTAEVPVFAAENNHENNHENNYENDYVEPSESSIEIFEPVAEALEQPSFDNFDEGLEDIAAQDTADSVYANEEPETIEEIRTLVAEQAAKDMESYASPEAETREYSAEETNIDGYIPQVEGDDYSIHETEVPAAEQSAEQQMAWEQPIVEEEVAVIHACPFCGAETAPQAFDCNSCRAVLSLSDIESVLASAPVNTEAIMQSVARMEADWNVREFTPAEMQTLAVGHFNLKSYDLGFAYLQEAARNDPNNVILAGQLNAMAIRLDEIRRQNEIVDAQPKGKSILVVDDSATVRKLISNKLEKSGHLVSCAEDGVEAMAWIEQNKPDLVLLDIAMPRMDGYQVCKLIRSNDVTKDVPVVMISGKDGFFDKVRGRMAGTTGYITKPFGPETLMRALETYLVESEVALPAVAE